MKTRREIIIGSLSSLAIPFIGKCSPIKSVLGAEFSGRNNIEEKGFVNPYIQDGLVSMIDGIENYDRGKESRVLKDIVTGYEAYIPNAWIVNNDNIYVTNTQALQFTDCVLEEDLTVEYIVAFLDNNTVRECAIENLTANNSFRIKKASVLSALFAGSNMEISTIEVGVPFCFSITYSASRSPKAISYVNGNYVNSSYFGHSMAGRYGNGFRIGRNGYTTFQGLYGVRIYNRALTEEEVEFNHEIDVERFGIE